MTSMRTAAILLVLASGLTNCGGSNGASTRPATGPSQVASTTTSLTRPVIGYVNDSAFRPLIGARVEVLDGPDAGTTATTGAQGAFGMMVTFNESTRFQATAEGHVPTIGTLYPCSTCQTRYVFLNLPSLTPPVRIAGDYTLTLIADGSCTGLPDALQTRTYPATITPASSAFSPPDTLFNLTASGASFLPGFATFTVAVSGDVVRFWLGNDGPSLVESPAPNTYVAFDGWAEAAVGSELSAVSTPFQGFVDYCALKSPMGSFYSCNPTLAVAHAECESNHHRLILTRR